ncbi:unnamed protein product, partial [Rhizoctonia solani]
NKCPPEGHTSSVNSVAFSPDGKSVASGSWDNTVRTWDAHNSSPIGEPLRGHSGWVWSVSYSPLGNLIASGSRDETIRLWDTKTGHQSGILQGNHSFYSVAFSPDARLIASGSGGFSYDPTKFAVQLWDVQRMKVASRPFKGHTRSVWSVSFSSDGTRLVSGSSDATIRVWDVERGMTVVGPLEGHSHSVYSAAFSPDSTQIVSCSLDRTIHLWDARDGRLIGAPYEGHTDWVRSVAFSPRGTYVASGGDDKTVRLWDTRTGRQVDQLNEHTDSVTSVAFSPCGQYIASGSWDRRVAIRKVLGDESYSDNDSAPRKVTSHMSITQIFNCLRLAGCVDLSSQMDSRQGTAMIVSGGGFGDIWKGKLRNGGSVAIKAWRTNTLEACDYKTVKCAAREVFLWSRMDHPHIHRLQGVILFRDQYLGMVSEWMDNGNLQEYLRKNPGADRFQLCTHVASGLEYMHSCSTVHGDLKAVCNKTRPIITSLKRLSQLNVLVTTDGIAQLSDFDFSVMSEASNLLFSDSSNSRMGSIRWTAPEILCEEVHRKTTQADVYALGMVCGVYEASVNYTQNPADNAFWVQSVALSSEGKSDASGSYDFSQFQTTEPDGMPLVCPCSDWEAISAVCKWLKFFRAALVCMSGEKYPTLSFSLHIYLVLIGYVSNLENDSTVRQNPPALNGIRACKAKLQEFLDRSTKDSQYYYFAMVLDPRYKDTLFKLHTPILGQILSDNWISNSAEAFVRTAAHFYGDTIDKSTQPQPAAREGLDVDEFDRAMHASIPQWLCQHQEPTSVLHEIQQYLAEPTTSMAPLDWWNKHSSRFPRLAAMARDYLCIPGSSVAVERVLSTGCDVISLRRAALSAETIRTLMNYRADIMLEKATQDVRITIYNSNDSSNPLIRAIGCRIPFDSDAYLVLTTLARDPSYPPGVRSHWPESSGRLMVVHEGTDWVYSVAFSPDGKSVASGSYDQTVRMWDAHNSSSIGEPLRGHSDSVNSVSYSPLGNLIASASYDSTIRLWDTNTGHQSGVPLKGNYPFYSVAFSPNAKLIASGSGGLSYDPTECAVQLWDVQGRKAKSNPFQGHTSPVRSVAFSSDITRLVSGSYDRTIRVWDVERGMTIVGPLGGHINAVNSTTFSPNDAQIVSCSNDRTIRLWDARNGGLIGDPLEGHTDGVQSVSFSPRGTYVASGGFDKTVRLWDIRARRQADQFEEHTGSVTSVTFSPCGQYIVSGSFDRKVIIRKVLGDEPDSDDDSAPRMVTSHMSITQIFECLRRAGCVDLSLKMDSRQDTAMIASGGGFGDIWKGKLHNGGSVAIKAWRTNTLDTCDYKTVKRAARELFLWSRMDHPHIHRLQGVILFRDQYLGMVSEWMDNGNLQEYLRKQPNADRFQLCTHVASGLEYMHSRSTVHGDLKALNVLVTTDGIARLSDFDFSVMSEASNLLFSESSNSRMGSIRWTVGRIILRLFSSA